jgi:L-malate glycosyltransferase
VTIITIPCLLNGGTEQQTLNLARRLVQRGLSVSLIVYFEFDLAMVKKFESSNIAVECLKWDRSIAPLQFVSQLRTLFKLKKPSIVHVQYMAPGALPILAAKLARVPRIIATVHQPWTPLHGRFAKWILRSAALLCNRFTVVSQNAERSWFGTSHLIEPDRPLAEQPKHLTLYNAVDVARLMHIQYKYAHRPTLEAHGIPNGSLIIGAVGRLRHEKGIDVLINAFARLDTSNQASRYLVIVGDGPDLSKLVELAESLGMSDRVVFVGSAPWEVAMQWLAQMDIVVIPSRFEGFGLTAAEAMAMSKPVVVSNTHGLSELVEHNTNGLTFEVDDEITLSKHLDMLLSKPDVVTKLGSSANATIRDRFDLPSYERNITTLYGLTAL